MKVLKKILNPVRWIFVAATISYGGARALKTKKDGVPGPEWFQDCINYIADWGWIAAVGWVFINPLLGWIGGIFDPKLKQKMARRIVNDLFERIKPIDAEDRNFRITIFKTKKFSWRALFAKRWPFGEWLCSYERSGFLRRRSRRVWKVDSNEPNSNEGVVGFCFAKDEAVYIADLPAREELSKANKKRTYAKQTRVSEEYLLKEIQRKPNYEWPRAFWGTKILVGGEPWGVLLIDTSLTEIGDDQDVGEVVKEYLKFCDIIHSVG